MKLQTLFFVTGLAAVWAIPTNPVVKWKEGIKNGEAFNQYLQTHDGENLNQYLEKYDGESLDQFVQEKLPY